MTKITVGSAKGHVLKVPTKETRPTSERVRETLFSRLDHMGVLQGARALDLYASLGVLGLEAASRDALKVELVEKTPSAAKVILESIRITRLLAQCRTASVVSFPAGHCGQALEGNSDLTLIDPSCDVAEEELAQVLRLLGPWLTRDTLVVVERSTHSPEPKRPDFLVLEDERRWGETAAWLADPPLEFEEAPALDRKTGEPDMGGDEADASEAERTKKEHA